MLPNVEININIKVLTLNIQSIHFKTSYLECLEIGLKKSLRYVKYLSIYVYEQKRSRPLVPLQTDI